MSESNQYTLVVSISGGFEILDISNQKDVKVLSKVIIASGSDPAKAAITPDEKFIFFPVYTGSTGYYIYDVSKIR